MKENWASQNKFGRILAFQVRRILRNLLVFLYFVVQQRFLEGKAIGFSKQFPETSLHPSCPEPVIFKKFGTYFFTGIFFSSKRKTLAYKYFPSWCFVVSILKLWKTFPSIQYFYYGTSSFWIELFTWLHKSFIDSKPERWKSIFGRAFHLYLAHLS